LRVCDEARHIAGAAGVALYRRKQTTGRWHVKKRSVIAALFACLVCSPVHAKTFVGVLWPMFGPLPAIGLVELVAELKMMPDVEVETYVHQAWPSLVEDLDNQPAGTRTIVIGYSLGANATSSVVNTARHVDEVIALQPSLLSWNPDIKGGTYGRFIEIYNPNPWETFGGMGSKKLTGPNIEYIANNDSHPGAQFSSQFRDLVKTEVTRLSTAGRVENAQAETKPPQTEAKAPAPVKLAEVAKSPEGGKPAEPAKPVEAAKPAKDSLKVAQAEVAKPPQPSQPPQHDPFAEKPLKHQPDDLTAFIEELSSSVDSGDLSAERQLTPVNMMDYVKRTYHVNPDATASCTSTCSDHVASN
jgi:hypothetical protein